ncbi:MAG: hypothetical protein FJ384_04595 [Verrucomicrobia bacterium]|nr:hypothetical protein [Verrucomicrobiota bacterium]
MNPASRRLVLLGVLAVLALAGGWWFAQTTDEPKPSARPARSVVVPKSGAARPVGAPRSANGLIPSAQEDVSVDSRPPDARRENIIREGIGTIQELKFMHPQVFDGAAKRWGEHPKTKALVAEWKEIEAGWKTQDEDAKAAQLPRMQAMWDEAMGLLRTEVEQSASEAGVK